MLEDYAPRDPNTGEFIAQNLTFLDTYLTYPPCPEMQVILAVSYDIPVATDVSPSGLQTFTVHTDWYHHDARTGPTIRDIVTAMSQLRSTYRRPEVSRYLPHKNLRYWDYQLPETLPFNTSLDQTLSFLGASNKAHAVGIAKRRTTVQLKMLVLSSTGHRGFRCGARLMRTSRLLSLGLVCEGFHELCSTPGVGMIERISL